MLVHFKVNTNDTDLTNAERHRSMHASQSTSSASTSSSVTPAVPPKEDIEDIEDIVKSSANQSPMRGDSNRFCSTTFGCSSPSQQCQQRVKDYQQQQQTEFIEFYNNTQSLRHTVALILLLCSMFVVSYICKYRKYKYFSNFYLLFSPSPFQCGL